MGAFTPFKRRANEFKYRPRYYDPAKEARDKRRAELRGTSYNGDEAEEYTPGSYIRRSNEARKERRKAEGRNNGKSNRHRVIVTIAVLLAALYMGNLLYGKILELFGLAPATTTQTEAVEEFNPYTPITIVPNDYNPSSEE